MSVLARPGSTTDRAHRPAPRLRGRRLRSASLFVVDVAAIALASALAILGRDHLTIFRPSEDIAGNVLPVAGVLLLIWIMCLGLAGAYQWKRIGVGAGEFNVVLSGSLLAAGVAGVTAYLASYDLSRGFYILVFLIGIPLLFMGRLAVRQVVHRLRARGTLGTQVLLVGDERHVEQLAAVLRRSRWLGYTIDGAILSTGPGTPSTRSGIPVLGGIGDVAEIARARGSELIIFTEGSFVKGQSFNHLARQLEDHHAQLVIVPSLTDVSAARMNLRPVAGVPLVYVESPRSARPTRWGKRAFDIVGSAALLILASPLMAAIAVAIKLEDGGPILFRQTRAGLKGKPFPCLKFRSMVPDAEKLLAELRERNEASAVLFKMKKDPRITRTGRFIRRFSLDELPQLWNVLRGEMSLVGPRPALPSEVAEYQAHVHRRLDVRPGLSGLWQVSGRSDLSWDDTVRLDLYYVDNWSMLQDLSILWRTVGAVLSSRGAY